MLGARDAERKPRPVGRLHFLESNDIDAHFSSLDRQYERLAVRLESVDAVVRQTHADLGGLCEQSRESVLRLQLLVEQGGSQASGSQASGSQADDGNQISSMTLESSDDCMAAERHAAVLASITGLAYRLDQVSLGTRAETKDTTEDTAATSHALKQIQASLNALQHTQQLGVDTKDAAIARLEQENAQLREQIHAADHLTSERATLEVEVAELGRQVVRRETQLEMLEQAYTKRYQDLEQLAERCSTLQLRLGTTVVDKYRSAVSLAAMVLRNTTEHSPERPRSPSLLPSRSSWMTPWLPEQLRPVRSAGDEPLRERLSNIPRLSPTKRLVRIASSPVQPTSLSIRTVSTPLLGPPVDENDV